MYKFSNTVLYHWDMQYKIKNATWYAALMSNGYL